MGLKFDCGKGQTLIGDEECGGLKLLSVTTIGELDEFEQKNIEEAIIWSIGTKMNAQKLLSETFVKKLHERMYGEVWNWAGKFRTSEKNLGINSWKIGTELKVLLDDTLFWMDNQTFSEDEIAIRFKHKLVSIHCFPNGNGRHSRLMADLLSDKIFNKPVFSWGQSVANGKHQGDVRTLYLKALKKADLGDYTELVRFSRL